MVCIFECGYRDLSVHNDVQCHEVAIFNSDIDLSIVDHGLQCFFAFAIAIAKKHNYSDQYTIVKIWKRRDGCRVYA